MCKSNKGLFLNLNEKFKPQHCETILSVLYYRLVRRIDENAEKWMGHLTIKTNKCSYKNVISNKKINLLMALMTIKCHLR